MAPEGQPGRVIGGRYRVVSRVGRGGFGTVHRARDEALDVDVAVKELRPPPGLPAEERAGWLARAAREARQLGRLFPDSGLVRLYDLVVDPDGESLWAVMDWVEGTSLFDELQWHGPLPAHRVAGIAGDVLRALNALHDAGIVHGGVTPRNILLAPGGGARLLLDLEGAVLRGAADAAETTEVLVGVPDYLAPEAVRGASVPAADFFSLGATLYHAVEGVPPFRRDGIEATLRAIMQEDPDPPRRAGMLAPYLMDFLIKDPERRAAAVHMLSRNGSLRQAWTLPWASLAMPARPGPRAVPAGPGPRRAPAKAGPRAVPAWPGPRAGPAYRPPVPRASGPSAYRGGLGSGATACAIAALVVFAVVVLALLLVLALVRALPAMREAGLEASLGWPVFFLGAGFAGWQVRRTAGREPVSRPRAGVAGLRPPEPWSPAERAERRQRIEADTDDMFRHLEDRLLSATTPRRASTKGNRT